MITASNEKEQFKETALYLLGENMVQMFSRRNMILKFSGKLCGWDLKAEAIYGNNDQQLCI